MRSKVHSFISYSIILFGLIHIYFARCLESFDTYALWFIGSGMAIIFAGFINLARTKSSEKTIYFLCIYTNILTTVLFLIALMAMKGIQVYIGIGLFAFALALCTRRAESKRE